MTKPMNSPYRILRMILPLCAAFASINPAGAQLAVATNAMYTADFQGKQGTHSWILDLKEDFNDFRVQVESPVGDLLIFLVEPGQARGTKLQPANRKCQSAASTGVRGSMIEATLPKDKKLGPGRHTIRVSPANANQNVGKYSIKVIEPTLDKPVLAETLSPSEKPAVPSSGSQDELLAELKSFREEMKALRDEMKAMEKRMAGLEGSKNGR